MASVRNLKKDINNVLGDIIDAVSLWEMTTTETDTTKGAEIIEEVLDTYDDLIAKVNQKNLEDRKAHFRSLKSEFETRARALVDKVNSL